MNVAKSEIISKTWKTNNLQKKKSKGLNYKFPSPKNKHGRHMWPTMSGDVPPCESLDVATTFGQALNGIELSSTNNNNNNIIIKY